MSKGPTLLVDCDVSVSYALNCSHLNLLADSEVPEFDSFVVAAGNDVEVVELQTGDAISVRSEKYTFR